MDVGGGTGAVEVSSAGGLDGDWMQYDLFDSQSLQASIEGFWAYVSMCSI